MLYISMNIGYYCMSHELDVRCLSNI